MSTTEWIMQFAPIVGMIGGYAAGSWGYLRYSAWRDRKRAEV